MKLLYFFLFITLFFSPKTHTVEPVTLTIIGALVSGATVSSFNWALTWWYHDPNTQKNSKVQGKILEDYLNNQKEEVLAQKVLAQAEGNFLLCKFREQVRNSNQNHIVPPACKDLAEMYIALGGTRAFNNIMKNAQ